MAPTLCLKPNQTMPVHSGKRVDHCFSVSAGSSMIVDEIRRLHVLTGGH